MYRHFPTKEALVVAVAEDRVRRIVDRARALLAVEGPGQALFVFFRDMVRSAAVDHGLVDALMNQGLDLEAVAPGVEAAFMATLGDFNVGLELGAPLARRAMGEELDLAPSPTRTLSKEVLDGLEPVPRGARLEPGTRVEVPPFGFGTQSGGSFKDVEIR